MALSLLRLHCCVPSTSYLLYTESQKPQQQFHVSPFVSLHSQHNNYYFHLSSSPSPSHAFTFRIKPKKVSPFVFHFSATTQDPVVDSSSSVSANTEQQQQQQEEEYSKTRLIAQNIPWTSTPEDIRALFEKHGTVLDVELSMYNKNRNRNRGLAFVTMGSPEEALAALHNLESHSNPNGIFKFGTKNCTKSYIFSNSLLQIQLYSRNFEAFGVFGREKKSNSADSNQRQKLQMEFEGRTLKINYAKEKKKNPAQPAELKPVPTFNLFVANLSFEARAKDLKEFFISEGWDIVSVQVIFHDNPRRSSGYGFVSFKSKKVAEEAISAFQGKLFMGRPLRVAPSRQFVKLQAKEGLLADDTTPDLITGAEEADTNNGN